MSDTTRTPAGNPAVVGLAGFGLTTIILQLHNLELCGLGPVVACGLVFGGLSQLLAGYQEFKVGNNFGFCAFVSYGAFWIALSVMLLFDKYDIYKVNVKYIGYFLIIWTCFTTILWIAALRIHGAMASTFTLLLFGFILLDLAHFGYPAMSKVAAYVLIFCSLNAWYIMAHVILLQIYSHDVLPVGKPWIDPRPTSEEPIHSIEITR